MNRMHLLVGLIAAAVLSGCGGEDEVAATPTPQPNPALQRELNALKDPTIKMARAVSPGKPGAAVDLKYDFTAKPEVGTPAEVKLALIPSAPADRLDIKITGMDGLTLAGALEKSFDSPKSGEIYEHTFSLMPNQNGLYYASVTATMETAGSQMSRTFSIPLAVGDAQVNQKPQVAPKTDATGQNVQPMKAEESGS